MKLKIIVQALLMLFGVTLVIDSVYARPSSGICFKHTETRCNANFYSCQENFKQQSNNGFTVLDMGNPKNVQEMSPFYEMEKALLFNGGSDE